MLKAEVDPSFLMPDELWQRIQPLLPAPLPRLKGGRSRMDDRKALDAIFYVLCTGCQWKINMDSSIARSSL